MPADLKMTLPNGKSGINQSLPAKGKTILHTQAQVRPGNSEDKIRIPIYEAEHNTEGVSAAHCNHVYNFEISGEDLPSLLPENSEVELEINVDSSRRIIASAYFPYIDEIVEVDVPVTNEQDVDSDWLLQEVDKAQHTVGRLSAEDRILPGRL